VNDFRLRDVILEDNSEKMYEMKDFLARLEDETIAPDVWFLIRDNQVDQSIFWTLFLNVNNFLKSKVFDEID